MSSGVSEQTLLDLIEGDRSSANNVQASMGHDSNLPGRIEGLGVEERRPPTLALERLANRLGRFTLDSFFKTRLHFPGTADDH